MILFSAPHNLRLALAFAHSNNDNKAIDFQRNRLLGTIFHRKSAGCGAGRESGLNISKARLK